MSDEHRLRESYPEFLSENDSPERLQVIRDIKALGLLTRPSEQSEVAMRTAVTRHVTLRAHGPEANPGLSSAHGGPRRRSRGWVPRARRGVGVAAVAGYALVVVAIALGLATMLPRARDAQIGAERAVDHTINGRMRAELSRLQPEVPFRLSAPTADLSRYKDVMVASAKVKAFGRPSNNTHVSINLYTRPLSRSPSATPGPDNDRDAPNSALWYVQYSFREAGSAEEQLRYSEEYIGEWRTLGKLVDIRGARGRLIGNDRDPDLMIIWWDGVVFHQMGTDHLTADELIRIARSVQSLAS